ncbi:MULTISPECIES: CsbD family protein [unclassified Streptomyces]|uniref:CsbD family protein n=1 Tax=unclassified Streptomyces TaxID=2593676 RepID=UPI0022547451|nr:MULTISPECIES: CsbD family protein [unclassified Streptomyces]MCX4775907.1 CsbD family protein [Streptomyces sp. NBC_01264]WSK24735.1 CsbD family protein [Streptomyces sp. NBC_01298]
MSKAKAKAKQAKGKLKETLGDTMDDKRMQAEGSTERMAGKAEEMASDAANKMKKAKGQR